MQDYSIAHRRLCTTCRGATNRFLDCPTMAAQQINELTRLVLARHYGITPTRVEPRLGYMSDCALVEVEGRQWVLKFYGRGATYEAALDESHRFTAFVARHAYPAPAPQPALDGETLVRHEGRLCALMPFVEGQVFAPGRAEQLAAAGQALGRLHQIAAGYPAPRSPGMIARELDDKRSDLAAVRKHLDTEVAADVELALAQSERLEAIDLPRIMIHGDFRAQNLLFHSDAIAAVLDFDMAEPAPRLVDLSYALAFFQAVIAPIPLSGAEAQAFLGAYESVQPLDDTERGLLPAFLRFSWVRGMLLWARIAYVDRTSDRAEGWMRAYRRLPSELARQCLACSAHVSEPIP